VVVEALEVVEEEQELFVTEPQQLTTLDQEIHRQQQFRSELVDSIIHQRDQTVMELHRILELQ
jgi:hypothetical protein